MFAVLPFILAGEPEVEEVRPGETSEELENDENNDNDHFYEEFKSA